MSFLNVKLLKSGMRIATPEEIKTAPRLTTPGALKQTASRTGLLGRLGGLVGPGVRLTSPQPLSTSVLKRRPGFLSNALRGIGTRKIGSKPTGRTLPFGSLGI
jgi:hypothetical protein